MARIPDANVGVNLQYEGSDPLPVVIVRDKKSRYDLGVRAAAAVIAFFLTSWIVMLLLPLVGLRPGYWAAAGIYLLANILFKTNINSLVTLYTREK